MSFADLETEALDSDLPQVSNLLSIAWARVSPLTPDDQIDRAAMQSLCELVKDDPLDCDDDTRVWLTCHGVTEYAHALRWLHDWPAA